MKSRLRKLRATLKEKGLDALIIFSPANISYLTGQKSPDAYLLLTPEDCFYITDGRYVEIVRRSIPEDFTLHKIRHSVLQDLAAICTAERARRIGFEEHATYYSAYRDLAYRLRRGMRLIPTRGLVEAPREIKVKDEIRRIKKGLRITARSLACIRKFLRPGISEIEVAAELERFIRYQGAENSPFDLIVASGSNSAFPHHAPGKKRLRRGEPVLIDMGVVCGGYSTDITRVFPVGNLHPLVDKVYAVVLAAQALALEKIKPGARARDIDAAARRYIDSRGYGASFVHSLGHGVGLQAHESPRLSAESKDTLKPGMVFTLEPAIYLPGKFGVRIEDMVLVTKSGCQLLSKAIPK